VAQLRRTLDELLAEDAAKVDRIVREVDANTVIEVDPTATGGDDWRKVRGVPLVARGTAGAIPGTNPLGALMAKQRRRS
jgi:hypothetical protein